MQIEEGAILAGKVTGLTDFGAFVELENGKTGMIHISEVSTSYVKDIKDFLTVGQEVKVAVVAVSPEGKISLSAKRVMEKENPAPKQQEGQKFQSRPKRNERRSSPPVWNGMKSGAPAPGEKQSFEDMMARFKQVSDEKMTDLKHANDSKRGGGYSRRGGNKQ